MNAGLFDDQRAVHEFPGKGTNGHEWRSFAVTARSRIPMNTGLPGASAVTARSRPLPGLFLRLFWVSDSSANAGVRAFIPALGTSFKSPTNKDG
jgi:hypothetical protein